MDTVITIIWQVVIMFLLAAVGYMMFRTKKISMEASKGIGNILIFLSLPCVIINSFLVERTPEKLAGLGISALLGFAVLLLAILITRFFFRRDAIANFAGSFSNPGFFGIPLITASLAPGSVFYLAAFIAFVNLGQWTYGTSLLDESDENGMLPEKGKGNGREQGAKEKTGLITQTKAMLVKLVKAPFMIAILIGLFFFLTGIPMPVILSKCITNIAGLNTPLAMFTIGIYLAQTDALAMVRKPKLYGITLIRMILCPAAAILVLSLAPASMYDMKMAILIAAACPVGSNVAVYAQLHNRDYTYAVETVIISTLASIITIPLIVAAAGLIW